MTTPKEKLLDLVEDFNIGMLITQAGGVITSRPMSIAEHDEENGSITFTTSLETEKVDEVMANPDIGVSFQSDTRYVSLSGSATVSNDREKIESLFSKSWELWYPEGPSDPSIRLIKFTPVIGEYWDMSGTSGIKFLWQAGKAMLKNEALDKGPSDQNQHAETAL